MAVALGGPAPIVQLLLTAQFQPAASSLTVLDLAALRELFVRDFPVFSQVNRAGAMPIYPGSAAENPFGAPRLSMSSEDLSAILLIQDDRISVGWNRLAPLTEDPQYPGFDSVLNRADELFQRAFSFIGETASESVNFHVGELAYTDAFVIGNNGVPKRPVGDVFTCINSIEDIRFNQLSLTYWKVLQGADGDPLEGSSETTISGLTLNPLGEAVANLSTTIRFPFESSTSDDMKRSFRLAHDVAHSIFSKLVKPGATAILDA